MPKALFKEIVESHIYFENNKGQQILLSRNQRLRLIFNLGIFLRHCQKIIAEDKLAIN